MQRGSLALVSRKEGPDVWQFRLKGHPQSGHMRPPRNRP
jgi:hypothetical protein